LITRLLHKEQPFTYELLLLADETVEAINKYFADSEIYGIEIDGELVGLYALYELNKEEIEIKNIAVSEGFQGKGIGTFLLKDAIEKSKQKGYKTIIIGTAETSIYQLNLYQRIGFQRFGIKKDFFLENYTEPIFENSILLRDMIMLKMEL
jgi:ribosomal protein S18 acetylase RimI-like enzyme